MALHCQEQIISKITTIKLLAVTDTLRIVAKHDLFTTVSKSDKYSHIYYPAKVDGRNRFTFLDVHDSIDLYKGYEPGIGGKYRNANEINFGCEVLSRQALLEFCLLNWLK